jgi:hypothetical protein
MRLPSFRLIAGGMFLFWVSISLFFYDNLGSNVRFALDNNDLSVFFARGAWVDTGSVPYRDVLSEYPQIPTYLFGLFRFPTSGDQALRLRQFEAIFSFAMLLAFLSTYWLLAQRLKGSLPGLLMLLPASIYFTFSRFDVLACLLVVLYLYFAQQRSWLLASALLALGFLTKWYPILFFPLLLAFQFRLEKKINFWMPVVFVSLALLVVLPTFLSGGLKAVLVPYTFQTARDLETISIPAIIRLGVRKITGLDLTGALRWLFLGAQMAFSPVSLFFQIDDDEKFLRWNLLIATSYVLFSSIYSPQWLLWLLPLFILTVRGWTDAAIWMIYDLISYLTFPILWDSYRNFYVLTFMGLLRHTVLILILLRNANFLWPGLGEKLKLKKIPCLGKVFA